MIGRQRSISKKIGLVLKIQDWIVENLKLLIRIHIVEFCTVKQKQKSNSWIFIELITM